MQHKEMAVFYLLLFKCALNVTQVIEAILD